MSTRTIDENNGALLVVANISTSRDGYKPIAYVLGAPYLIETTLFTPEAASFNNNIRLREMWSGSPTKTEKEEEGKTADAYSRYAIDPETASTLPIDAQDGIIGQSVYSFRRFKNAINRIIENDTPDELSGFAYIDVNNNNQWVSSGKEQLRLNVDDDPIDFIKFKSGDKATEFNLKDWGKSVTGMIVSQRRPWGGSDDTLFFDEFSSGEFVPFTVQSEDRYVKKTTDNSYITVPSGATRANETIRDDQKELTAFATSIIKGNTVPVINAEISMIGRNYWQVGDLVDKLIMQNGITIELGIAIASLSFLYEPVKQGGGSPVGDTTAISLGRL